MAQGSGSCPEDVSESSVEGTEGVAGVGVRLVLSWLPFGSDRLRFYPFAIS